MKRIVLTGTQLSLTLAATVGLMQVSLPCVAAGFSSEFVEQITPELAGQVNLEHRQFFSDGLQGQDKGQSSLVLQPEFYWEQQEGNGSFTFTPFYRLDSEDDERTHGDVREALYLNYWDDYELRAGVGKVFWGVTESAHLVDVVNQTDAIESVDGESKLGQPMVHFTSIKDWGTIDAMLLPYFRERTFAGEDGRLRTPVPVSDDALYESSREEKHVDVALRYSQMYGDWDVGLSYLGGTNRDPYYRVEGNELKPYYAQMQHFGLDVQGIIGDWLWKLESIYRDSYDNHTGVATGFEYTWVGALESYWDIGFIAEYLYDSRGNNAQTIGQNDVFLGARFALNDEDGTEVLTGITQDLDNSDVYSAKLEASSRINNNLKWRLNAWLFENETPEDLLFFARKDDFVEMALEYYF
ncbi:hypothetical protein BCU85_17475 [Vibrio lentus]|uniref:hypothetical protein n=1 Tax=Vibrio lentus TaxID=136468 RepID=UPI000C837C01|nr:hypothetical protein [Vibrio lentus]MCC4817405.1 hypothetical protein [Vibrio lentus]PMG72340.1 hypothetical protein BCU85_17475 [Vibrio lentus]PMK91246.1 hypothetical protein BCT88_03135 [Vibrio lentus]PML22280.1 hypothetical protein BCT80_09905 [Vibrio lentus]PMM26521.1 hypothetical protein BCT57_18070 [Vibrio lentus]